MMGVLLLQNDARKIPLRDRSVHMICTSPPYFGLRDYNEKNQIGLEYNHDCLGWATGQRCEECYLCVMTQVFRECWRVLRDDGVMFVVISDSYAQKRGHGHWESRKGKGDEHSQKAQKQWALRGAEALGLRPKSLLCVPQRLSLALQRDEWILRSEIIWCKTSPMPESVTDRPTSATEKILLFTKQECYYWDQEAVRVPAVRSGDFPGGGGAHRSEICAGHNKDGLQALGCKPVSTTRNLWNYWLMGTEPFTGAHFATMPTALVDRCIKAGSSSHGVCAECGTPWIREVERKRLFDGKEEVSGSFSKSGEPFRIPPNGVGHYRYSTQHIDKGFSSSCSCQCSEVVPSIVYDPFSGSGTVPLVARSLGRHGIGSDLSCSYLQIARKRLGLKDLAAWYGDATSIPDSVSVADLPLFQGI